MNERECIHIPITDSWMDNAINREASLLKKNHEQIDNTEKLTSVGVTGRSSKVHLS